MDFTNKHLKEIDAINRNNCMSAIGKLLLHFCLGGRLMNESQVMDYTMSLVHLYGLVHKDKVVEIYNMQNEDRVDIEQIDELMKNYSEELMKYCIEICGEYFVEDAILEFSDFDEELEKREGKPFYFPEKEELLKYKDSCYFEENEKYRNLYNYLKENIFNGDEFKAQMLCEDIQGICQFAFSIDNIFDEFNRRKVNFKDGNQVNEVMQLVIDLANNTRLQENNGHTPKEIFEEVEKPHLKELSGKQNKSGKKKIGRNELCSCGSGKKYKKCCLG